jgi:hypothetical protein
MVNHCKHPGWAVENMRKEKQRQEMRGMKFYDEELEPTESLWSRIREWLKRWK